MVWMSSRILAAECDGNAASPKVLSFRTGDDVTACADAETIRIITNERP